MQKLPLHRHPVPSFFLCVGPFHPPPPLFKKARFEFCKFNFAGGFHFFRFYTLRISQTILNAIFMPRVPDLFHGARFSGKPFFFEIFDLSHFCRLYHPILAVTPFFCPLFFSPILQSNFPATARCVEAAPFVGPFWAAKAPSTLEQCASATRFANGPAHGHS